MKTAFFQQNSVNNKAADCSAAKIHSTFNILIFSFLSKKAYATSNTTLSNAFPIPTSNAMPLSVGIHTFVEKILRMRFYQALSFYFSFFCIINSKLILYKSGFFRKQVKLNPSFYLSSKTRDTKYKILLSR